MEILLQIINSLNEFGQIKLFTVGNTTVTIIGILKSLTALLVILWSSRFIRKALKKLLSRRANFTDATIYLFDRLFHYAIIVIASLIALTFLGMDVSNLILLASALGVGIGFGMQSIANNFVSGLIMLFERNIKVGDFVVLQSGIQGSIKEINIRSTLMTTPDNLDIIIPNAEFISSQVTNWTLHDEFVRVHIPFGVAYGTDKDLVKKAVLEAADTLPFTVKNMEKKEPMVWLVKFGESSLDFELVVWVNTRRTLRPGMIRASYMWEIETKLREYNIEIPFPQRDVHLKSGFEKLNSREN